MKVPLTLRTRLALWFSASVLLILLPYLGGMLALEWRAMSAALDHHLEEDLEVVLEMLVVENGTITWRTKATRDLGYDGGFRRWVEVYGRDGAPLFFRGRPEDPGVRATLPSPGAAGGRIGGVRTPAGARVRLLEVASQVGNAPVTVRVARSEDALRASHRWLIVLFLVSAPLAVLAATVAGYVVSGRALLPLARMTAQARTISAERLSERLPVGNATDEMGQLALVFNETFTRLEQSFEQLTRFTADASHELRTPLTALRSVGEVALREGRSEPDLREAIGSMLEETDRLARLVETLLTLARWESGRIPASTVELDLATTAREVASQLEVLAEERDITTTVDLRDPLPVVADAIMLRQALINLVDNAIKFTPPGGRVHVSGRASGTRCEVAVDDSGPGIPAGQRTRVRERFCRAEDEATRAVRGAGLGLAVADWAVTANQGRIDIADSPLGGARLVVSLPRANS